MLQVPEPEASKDSKDESGGIPDPVSSALLRDPSLEMTLKTLHVRYIVAGNPNTPKEVLAKLSTDVLETVRRRVAENARCPVTVLSQLVFDPSVDVRLAVAENTNTPPELLEQLAADDCVDVSYCVAENPHIPVEILRCLAEDSNPYVSCRAQKTVIMVLSL